VVTPLLANIALNHLDWRLHEAGYRFARYADDFVVVCQTHRQAEQARALVEQVLTELGGNCPFSRSVALLATGWIVCGTCRSDFS